MIRYVLTEDVNCLREVGNEYSDIGAASWGEVFVRAEDAEAAIAELEMFKQQWAVADAALVGARQRIAELEAAIDKLAAGKGRYHTEANYLALIAVRNKSLHK